MDKQSIAIYAHKNHQIQLNIMLFFILKVTDLASLDGMDQCEYIFFLTTEIQCKPNY